MNDTVPRTQPWYVRPRIMLPLISALVLAVVLVTPEPQAGSNDQRLTSFSTRPPGVRLLYELVGRMGWNVERSTSAALPLDSSGIVMLLAPPIPLREREVHALLEHVRGGGALFVIASGGAQSILDSLGLEPAGIGDSLSGPPTARSCPRSDRAIGAFMSGDLARFATYSAIDYASPEDSAGRMSRITTPILSADTLLSVRINNRDDRGAWRPVVLALSLGRGRVVVSTSTFLLRNDMMRRCASGFDLVAARSLRYLASGAGQPRRVVFDEYHQGYGQRAGSLTAILAEFAGTPPGRVLYQLAGAGMLLLLALAPRALPPRDPAPPDRRSPLEHVEALARAYQQVGARRTAAERLVRGLRRRVQRTHARAGNDLFLQQVEQRHPELRHDVAVLRAALQDGADASHWSTVPDALARIEHTLTRT